MIPHTIRSPQHVAHAISALALVVTLVASFGCTTSRPAVSADPDQRDRELSQGYALLYDLLQENRRVNQATRIPFRSVSDETSALLDDIAEASGNAADQLYDLAEATPAIGLDQDGLPVLESATRDAIASTTTSDLLTGDRDHFEKYLLLTQTEATRYAAHLAGQLAEAEAHGARRVFLRDVRQRFEQLYEQVLARLAVQE